MAYPVPPCSSQELLTMLRNGEYDQFLVSLERLPIKQSDWFRFQMLAMKVLVARKRTLVALQHIKKLSAGLTNPEERQSAQAECLFYSWLLEGRSAAVLHELEATLNSHQSCNDSFISLQSLVLRTNAMKLQLSLMDVRQKPELVQEYRLHIDNLYHCGLEDEAFFCFLELVDFIIAKPTPNIPDALILIEEQLELPAIRNNHYRKAILELSYARLSTELSFQLDQYPISHHLFHTGLTSLQNVGAKSDVGQNLALYGAMLLNYGNVMAEN